jgi:hypothetical protein
MTAPNRSGPTVAQVIEIAELSEPAVALAGPSPVPRDFLQKLIDAKLHRDAIAFMAHGLPRREAVWWAWVTAKRAAGATPLPKIKASLDATERWVAQPSEENSHRARELAEAADFGTPAGLAGLAAYFSGPSLTPPGQTVVPAPPFAASKMIAGAILLASMGEDPEAGMVKLLAAIKQGIEVGAKVKLWAE